MKTESHHFAEYVSPGHPDRLADAIAESIVDHAMARDDRALVGVEVAVHTNKVFVDGRVAWRTQDGPPSPPLVEIAQDVYRHAGYGGPWSPAPETLVVTDDLCREVLSEDEALIRPHSDDQNIVCGFATPNLRTNQLPAAHLVANRIGRHLFRWRKETVVDCGGKRQPAREIFGPDFKLLPHLVRLTDGSGLERWRWGRLTLSIQHVPRFYYEDQHRILFPVVKEACESLALATGLVGLEQLEVEQLFLNGAGDFHIGGPQGDNGLSGKKLVVDHYGPEVPIGGGALCGKDPHKIDRVGPLRARQLARQLAVAHNADAHVRLVWSPGDTAPSHVEASLVVGGKQTTVPTSQLPPRDWFTIEAVFQDLKLEKIRWRNAAEAGYFASSEHPWER